MILLGSFFIRDLAKYLTDEENNDSKEAARLACTYSCVFIIAALFRNWANYCGFIMAIEVR